MYNNKTFPGDTIRLTIPTCFLFFVPRDDTLPFFPSIHHGGTLYLTLRSSDTLLFLNVNAILLFFFAFPQCNAKYEYEDYEEY